MLHFYGADGVNAEIEEEWFASLSTLQRFEFIDSEQFLNDCLNAGRSILAEGAQGSMLDIDFGSYPFVTSSNTVCAGACTGLGVAPNRIGDVIGIFKAYCTRVGSGPFPTELFDQTGDDLCRIGNEFGSTTGRRRRCGWLDIPALKYAIMINGVTELNMMKTDVMDTFDTIRICTHYKMDGKVTDLIPFDQTVEVEPVYVDMKGWKTDLTKLKSQDPLPVELVAYIAFIEQQTGIPISIVSVGPDRQQTLTRDVISTALS
jgi:adenylosuccinate synthase